MPDHRPAPLDPAPPAVEAATATTRCGPSCASSRAAHPRWGYRKAWASLRERGLGGEPQEDPAALARGGPAGAAAQAEAAAARHLDGRRSWLRAERPDHVWALDFQFDTTTDGRVLKLLHVVDEHTREALAIQVERRIDADHTVRVLDRIVRGRGRRPELVRMDNGPELTANALRDWCRFGGVGTSYIEPGSPGRTRSSNRSAPASATRCSPSRRSTRCSRRRPSSKNGRTTYNHKRPHSSLGWKTPSRLRRHLETNLTTRLS